MTRGAWKGIAFWTPRASHSLVVKSSINSLLQLLSLSGEGLSWQGSPVNASGPSHLLLDQPWDGKGLVSVPADDVISPVFTMWITLMALVLGTAAVVVARGVPGMAKP